MGHCRTQQMAHFYAVQIFWEDSKLVLMKTHAYPNETTWQGASWTFQWVIKCDRWTAESMEDGRLCMLSVWHYILYAWLCLTWIYGQLLIFTRSYKPLNKHMREQNFVRKLQKAEIKGYTMLLAHYQNRPILALKLNIGYQSARQYLLI